MATTTIPEATYPVGTTTIGPVNVPNGATLAVIRFSRDKWLDPAVKLTLRMELSLDNGATWSPNPSGESVWPWGIFPVVITAQGGESMGMGGVVETHTMQEVPLPDPNNNRRRVRFVRTVEGGPLTTVVTIDVT